MIRFFPVLFTICFTSVLRDFEKKSGQLLRSSFYYIGQWFNSSLNTNLEQTHKNSTNNILFEKFSFDFYHINSKHFFFYLLFSFGSLGTKNPTHAPTYTYYLKEIFKWHIYSFMKTIVPHNFEICTLI